MIYRLKDKTHISISTPCADVVHVTSPNVNTTTSDTSNISANFVFVDKPMVSARTLENAVYNYLRSLKTVGRQSVGVEEVASALGLSTNKTKEIVARLKNRIGKMEKVE